MLPGDESSSHASVAKAATKGFDQASGKDPSNPELYDSSPDAFERRFGRCSLTRRAAKGRAVRPHGEADLSLGRIDHIRVTVGK
jgi:hypothetical protein